MFKNLEVRRTSSACLEIPNFLICVEYFTTQNILTRIHEYFTSKNTQQVVSSSKACNKY